MKRLICFTLCAFLIGSISLAFAETRPAAVAGLFYPASAKELTETVDRYLNSVPSNPAAGELLGLLVPHAGYPFSGSTAAYAFKRLEGRSYATVILIGLAHAYPISGAAIWPKGEFETLLGRINVDEKTAKALLKRSSKFEALPAAHLEEHSLEVELPFLQRTLKGFEIVPLLMANPDLETCREIGGAIAEVVKKNAEKGIPTLLVVSTDLAHFPKEEDARRVDEAVLKAIEKMDPEALNREDNLLMTEGIPGLDCTLCAKGATLAALYAMRALGANRVTLLRHATSAEALMGDAGRVVGYGAVSFERVAGSGEEAPAPVLVTQPNSSSSENKPEEGRGGDRAVAPTTVAPAEKSPSSPAPVVPFTISGKNQKKLLKLARKSLEKYFKGETVLEEGKPSSDRELSQKAAVFVTLTKQGELRGCIGSTEPQFPLDYAVRYFARQAAVEDPRFPPLTKSELEEVRIEISVLSPMKWVASADDIQPGRDGVVVIRGERSGLFLPQVWEQLKWSKELFLSELCSQKAGLAADAWRDPQTQLFTFTVVRFEEGK